MTNTTHFTSFLEYKAAEIIWNVVPPIFIVLGTFGNVLSILVLNKQSILSSTMTSLLTVLAGSDLIVLYTGMLRQWLKYTFYTDIRQLSVVSCKLNAWLLGTFLDWSAWILVGVTMERAVSVMFPHRTKHVCTKRTAAAYMSSSLVFLLLLNSHFAYGFSLSVDYDGNVTHTHCKERDSDYGHFLHTIWPDIEICVFCIVPCSLVFLGNCLIFAKVLKKRRQIRSSVLPALYAVHQHRPPSSHWNQSSMTTMLMTLSCVFLLSTMPVTVYNVGHATWLEKAKHDNDGHAIAVLKLWWAVVNVLMYSSNALNFFLYCLSGEKFRKQASSMIFQKRCSREVFIQCLYPINTIRGRFLKSVEVSTNRETSSGDKISRETTIQKSDDKNMVTLESRDVTHISSIA